MARVLNLYGTPRTLYSKDGDSCLIPVGEGKVQDKFCVNLPPKVKLLEMKKAPVIKEKTPVAATSPTPATLEPAKVKDAENAAEPAPKSKANNIK